MCISVYGVKLRNSYDENITSAATVQILQKDLSTYFFMVTMVTVQTRNSEKVYIIVYKCNGKY